MRILKPIKSPAAGSSKRDESEPGDLTYDAEEVGVDKVGEADDESAKITKSGYRGSKGSQSAKECGKTEPKKEYDRLLSKGIRLLSMREHSVQEIITKLSVKCDSLDIMHVVVERLLESKYLSNERFTESYIRSRTNRGFGPTKIRSELIQKGIKNNMIDDYLNVSSSVWYENAQNQYSKKYGDAPVSDYNTWAKRARFLQSRGFTMEQIQVTVPSVDYD